MGITFYEMLVGEYPFKAKSAKDLLKQVSTIPVSSLIPKKFSPQVHELLRRLLEINMEERISYEELKKFLLPDEYIPKFITNKAKNSIKSG